jgi:hypothetical protein
MFGETMERGVSGEGVLLGSLTKRVKGERVEDTTINTNE